MHHCIHKVRHMQVGLLLRAITEDVEVVGIGLEFIDEIQDYAVCRRYANDIGEAEEDCLL